jgi:hypothetical protein
VACMDAEADDVRASMIESRSALLQTTLHFAARAILFANRISMNEM